ncbi:MAG: type II toxin-antitoxin system VapC family toxin [Solirubrobacteraceae bacterium]
MTVCLDSWAVLEWLDGGEPATTVVDRELEAGRPLMCTINIGEVAYHLERRHGYEKASAVVRELVGTVTLDEVTLDRVLAAARIKAAHPIAFADCFAVATAVARSAVLLTGDPELLDRDLGCEMRDLRSVA